MCAYPYIHPNFSQTYIHGKLISKFAKKFMYIQTSVKP